MTIPKEARPFGIIALLLPYSRSKKERTISIVSSPTIILSLTVPLAHCISSLNFRLSLLGGALFGPNHLHTVHVAFDDKRLKLVITYNAYDPAQFPEAVSHLVFMHG